MLIQVLYFDGCPSYRPAVEAIRSILSERSIDAELNLIRVSTQQEAQLWRFLGSPTIRINGEDIEGGADPGGEYSLRCRLYSVHGKPRGWPPREQLERAILKKRPIDAGHASP